MLSPARHPSSDCEGQPDAPAGKSELLVSEEPRREQAGKRVMS